MKKIFLVLVAIIGITMSGCGKNNDEIDFTVGFKNMDFWLGQDTEAIVNTAEEWNVLKPNSATITEFDNYGSEFFATNSLIVYVFTRSWGNPQVEVIKVNKSENELVLNVVHFDGDSATISHGIVVVEVKKVDIVSVNSLRVIGK